MDFEHIILLAFIQGVTEFLPISSSGHLNLVHGLFTFPDQGVIMDVALHGGTLLAVLVYFWRDIAYLLGGGIDILQRQKTPAASAASHIIVASLPVLLLASILFITGWINLVRHPEIIAWASILFAIPLYFADQKYPQNRNRDDMQTKDAMVIGVAQIFSLIPGASRAGVTIMAGRYLGLSRPEAARFSMLLACPVIFALTLSGFIELAQSDNPQALTDALWGAGLAAMVAFMSIHIFLKLLQRISLLPFIIYRIGLGVMILLVL